VPTLARLSLALQKGGTRPDLIVVDVNPDNSDDLTMLRDLRRVAGLEDIPVVALTDRKAVHGPLRAMRAGANDVLFKPVDPNEARDVLSRVMELKKIHRPGTSAVGRSIVFMHLSGGAGATTLAVNTACALAKTPHTKQSCLIDLDIQFGNAASLLDLPSTSPVQEFIDDPARLDESMLESMMLRHQTGLQVLTAPRVLMPLSAYGSDGIRNLIDVAKRNYEYVGLGFAGGPIVPRVTVTVGRVGAVGQAVPYNTFTSSILGRLMVLATGRNNFPGLTTMPPIIATFTGEDLNTAGAS
jgi:pilus assembly protein CpaE